MNRFRFVPNIPQIVSLASPEGEYDSDAEQVSYHLEDGRTLVLTHHEAESLNLLDLKPGETFGLCKRWDGELASRAHIDIWLTPATEQTRAAAEPPKSLEPEPPPAKRKPRTAKVAAIRTEPDELQPQGNGTTGPAPLPRPAIAARSTGRIPWDIAFQEVVRFVTDGLKATGEQWSDQAKQGAVSTVLIAASKAGLISLWER
jgi:hypothetical protein